MQVECRLATKNEVRYLSDLFVGLSQKVRLESRGSSDQLVPVIPTAPELNNQRQKGLFIPCSTWDTRGIVPH